MMFTASEWKEGPFTIRYPRGQGVMLIGKTDLEKIEVGKRPKTRDGNDLAILSIGHIGNYAAAACRELEAKDISAAHYDMRFVKPLDEEMLHEISTIIKG